MSTVTKHEVQTGLFPLLLLEGCLKRLSPLDIGKSQQLHITVLARADVDFPPPLQTTILGFGDKKSLHASSPGNLVGPLSILPVSRVCPRKWACSAGSCKAGEFLFQSSCSHLLRD